MFFRRRSRLRLGIHPFAASGLFLIFCAAPRAYAFALLSSVILHEAGHLTALFLFGRAPDGIRLMPTGISISLPPPRSYVEEITVAAAGPFMSFLWSGVAVLLPSAINEQTQNLSLLLGVINLLPITDLDGGRISHVCLLLLFGQTAADRFVKISTAVCLAGLWVLSLYIFFYSGINMGMLVFCAYLFSYLIVKKL